MFRDQVVAITGAGSGIGQALAVQIAARGAQLALIDISRIGLAATVGALPAGSRSITYPLDATSREAVFWLADTVRRDSRTFRYIINNAGTAITATLEHASIAEIGRALAINLWGGTYGTKAFLHGAYLMSKFAVRGLAETPWTELEGTGVRAVVVRPGGINTSIATNSPITENETDPERHVTSPSRCARLNISGLESGKPRLVVGSGARFMFWVSRLFPTRNVWLMRRHYSIGLR